MDLPHGLTPRQKLNSERSDGGYGHNELPMVREISEEQAERPDSQESEDADDEQDLGRAALLIQGKYRERLQRRSRGELGLGEDEGRSSGTGVKRDGLNKNGCSSPTSDDSGISPVTVPEIVIQ